MYSFKSIEAAREAFPDVPNLVNVRKGNKLLKAAGWDITALQQLLTKMSQKVPRPYRNDMINPQNFMHNWGAVWKVGTDYNVRTEYNNACVAGFKDFEPQTREHWLYFATQLTAFNHERMLPKDKEARRKYINWLLSPESVYWPILQDCFISINPVCIVFPKNVLEKWTSAHIANLMVAARIQVEYVEQTTAAIELLESGIPGDMLFPIEFGLGVTITGDIATIQKQPNEGKIQGHHIITVKALKSITAPPSYFDLSMWLNKKMRTGPNYKSCIDYANYTNVMDGIAYTMNSVWHSTDTKPLAEIMWSPFKTQDMEDTTPSIFHLEETEKDAMVHLPKEVFVQRILDLREQILKPENQQNEPARAAA